MNHRVMLIGLAFGACSCGGPPRYEIHQVNYGTQTFPVLLDTQTGQTWDSAKRGDALIWIPVQREQPSR